MTSCLDSLSFPEHALGEVVVSLAARAGLSPRDVVLPAPAPPGPEGGTLSSWLSAAAEYAGVQAEPVDCSYAELPRVLARIAPAIVAIAAPDGPRYLALSRSCSRRLSLLTPGSGEVRVPLEQVRALLTSELETRPLGAVDRWFAAAGVGAQRARRARVGLSRLLLAEQRISQIWLLRADPGSSFVGQLRRQGIAGRLIACLLLALVHVLLSTYGWVLLGRGALGGVLDLGWMGAWVLLSLSSLPVQIAFTRLGGSALNDIAGLLEQRLLCGALRMDADLIRTTGTGRLIAMVGEAEVLRGSGLSSALGLAFALVQLLGATFVLVLGPSALLHVSLLLAWCLWLGVLIRSCWLARSDWTRERLALTNSLLENVLGNRTRIAQQPQRRWHLLEDQGLRLYAQASQRLDALEERLSSVPARGWLCIAMLALLPLLFREHTRGFDLAIAVGGILQTSSALRSFSDSAVSSLSTLVAWRQIRGLYHAASALPAAGHPAFLRPSVADAGAAAGPVLDLCSVSFRYDPAREPVLRACNLSLHRGDRMLLEGPSGGGKSTLAALLRGTRVPEVGQVLLGGLDRAMLGQREWLRRVASTPQFHENHILSATLAFNLLMGRSWPPSPQDLREAEAVCRKLGLGGLLDKMPSRLQQVVGETGWQLSHGERSRLYLARALLQRADVVILDESFGALDPHTARQCLDTVLEESPTLMLIAHP